MEIHMSGNLFAIFLVTPFVFVTWISVYLYVIRRLNKEKRCAKCVRGRVIGWSLMQYGGLRLPKVQYTVDGKDYKIVGPKFQVVKTISISGPFANLETAYETNLRPGEELPKSLEIKMHRNSGVSVTRSPLAELFPAGSEVNVFYNEKKPGDAYVERFEGISKPIAALFLAAAVITTALLLFAIFGPEIGARHR